MIQVILGGLAILLALAVAYWALAWPWMVASQHSIPLAWAAEVAYLLLACDIAVYALRGRRVHAAKATQDRLAREQQQQVADQERQRAEAERRRIAEQTQRAFAEQRRRIAQATPRWAQAATDPKGQQRWWDGSAWTDRTQWEYLAVRPEGTHFTHGGCSVKHRTADAARRCRLG